jgi:putative acetyltransferase
MFHIRQATASDIPEMMELYKNAVLTVNRKDYSDEEVEDWASCGDNMPHWRELFAEQHYIVAANERSQIVGFASINDTGYMHILFEHKYFNIRESPRCFIKYLKNMPKKKVLIGSHPKSASRRNRFLKNKA